MGYQFISKNHILPADKTLEQVQIGEPTGSLLEIGAD